MSQPLIIVGSGGFARETLSAVHAINSVQPTWDVLGFVDDDASKHGTTVSGAEVIGPLDSIADHPDAGLVVCTGHPGNYFTRRQIVERLNLEHERYAKIVHPRASLGSGATLGHGCVLLANVVATVDVQIGDFVTMMPNVLLTHDDLVGDYCSIAGGSSLAGGVTLKTGAYIGAGALVRTPVTVGEWSLVGMGSMVFDDIGRGEVWVGTPARKLRELTLPDGW